MVAAGSDHFQIVTTMPRRVIAYSNSNSLSSASLSESCTLMVELTEECPNVAEMLLSVSSYERKLGNW